MNGGKLYVNASGDGVDVNGYIEMTGGLILVDGPTNSGNGPLDYDNTFKMTGGYLVAVGSAGMAQAPSTRSTQNAVLVRLSSTQSAGNLVHIDDSTGKGILTYKPAKSYQSVVFSSPKLVKGSTYKVYTGGSSTGTLTDGLYQGGTYTYGTLSKSFTQSSVITQVN